MSTIGYIGNVIQSIELIPFEGDAIKEEDIVREAAVVETAAKSDERELVKA